MNKNSSSMKVRKNSKIISDTQVRRNSKITNDAQVGITTVKSATSQTEPMTAKKTNTETKNETSVELKYRSKHMPNYESKVELKYEPKIISKVESRKSGFLSGLRVNSVLKTWAEVSKINFLSKQPLDLLSTVQSSIKRRSISMPMTSNVMSEEDFLPYSLHNKSDEDLFTEQFPINVTSLMNENQHWGCFYIFPEFYADVYSPVVHIRQIEDIPEIVGGVLTRDMVTASLTYLRRTPILGDYVYVKLVLSSKHLINIEVLQHYKYLVYLDLSINYLTELTVLSHLQYLQCLYVSYNRLSQVLDYEVPQWFLTEVHYKYNSVKRIRDLTMFWSITILDLSHNNIKCISGLENLKYLRRLDLSFNHIQRLENLNNLRLLWLDVSYNNISSFEFSPETGLWTLLHLEYLNLNENNFTSMKMFSGCTRLRELHARNNRLGMLLELAVYMRKMRRLIILDLRANPICSTPGYKEVVINTFPLLLNLDSQELDAVEQRGYKMTMAPEVSMFATRRLLRLLYIEQLSRARVSPDIPPADTDEVPLVILVGYEAVGKGSLSRRLATECKSNIELARLHTTSVYHSPGHYIETSRSKFDDMLLAGDFLTYSEMDGESYGLSREEAFIKGGKVRIACMDLTAALMMTLRGRRPYLILASCLDKQDLASRQKERKTARNQMCEAGASQGAHGQYEKSTLQVLISGRILIRGILNEILMSFPDEKEASEFLIESECSLLMDSEARQAVKDYAVGVNMKTLLGSSITSLEDVCDRAYKSSQNDNSLCSLYKESQNTDEDASYTNGAHGSFQDSGDIKKYQSSTWKGLISTKSSKSVTFTSQDRVPSAERPPLDTTGMLIEAPTDKEREAEKSKQLRSLSTKLRQRTGSGGSMDDLDLWMAFLIETGLVRISEPNVDGSDTTAPRRQDTRVDDPDYLMKQLEFYHRVWIPSQTSTTNITDDYEDIHRKCPGLFWDTVSMDDPEKAFIKVKRIIRNIIMAQSNLKPMFDIDFANQCKYYPFMERKLKNLCNEIAPQRLFF